jgi:hypothetical protein
VKVLKLAEGLRLVEAGIRFLRTFIGRNSEQQKLDKVS